MGVIAHTEPDNLTGKFVIDNAIVDIKKACNKGKSSKMISRTGQSDGTIPNPQTKLSIYTGDGKGTMETLYESQIQHVTKETHEIDVDNCDSSPANTVEELKSSVLAS